MAKYVRVYQEELGALGIRAYLLLGHNGIFNAPLDWCEKSLARIGPDIWLLANNKSSL